MKCAFLLKEYIRIMMYFVQEVKGIVSCVLGYGRIQSMHWIKLLLMLVYLTNDSDHSD